MLRHCLQICPWTVAHPDCAGFGGLEVYRVCARCGDNNVTQSRCDIVVQRFSIELHSRNDNNICIAYAGVEFVACGGGLIRSEAVCGALRQVDCLEERLKLFLECYNLEVHGDDVARGDQS